MPHSWQSHQTAGIPWRCPPALTDDTFKSPPCDFPVPKLTVPRLAGLLPVASGPQCSTITAVQSLFGGRGAPMGLISLALRAIQRVAESRLEAPCKAGDPRLLPHGP